MPKHRVYGEVRVRNERLVAVTPSHKVLHFGVTASVHQHGEGVRAAQNPWAECFVGERRVEKLTESVTQRSRARAYARRVKTVHPRFLASFLGVVPRGHALGEEAFKAFAFKPHPVFVR